MNYQFQKLCEGIRETPWSDLDDFAELVLQHFNGVALQGTRALCHSLSVIAEQKLGEAEEQKAEEKRAKQRVAA